MFAKYSGKKTEPLKTKITEYCHTEFLALCGKFTTTPSVILRSLAIWALMVWRHKRFEELIIKIESSDLNERGVINDIINEYLDGDLENNVYRISRNREK